MLSTYCDAIVTYILMYNTLKTYGQYVPNVALYKKTWLSHNSHFPNLLIMISPLFQDVSVCTGESGIINSPSNDGQPFVSR